VIANLQFVHVVLVLCSLFLLRFQARAETSERQIMQAASDDARREQWVMGRRLEIDSLGRVWWNPRAHQAVTEIT
jgi:hypothetical protein